MVHEFSQACYELFIQHYCTNVYFLQSAVGWDYQAQLAKHASQTDAAKGFGGKYGVQKERVDKVCVCVGGGRGKGVCA